MMLGQLLIAEGALDPDGLQEALDWQVLYGGRLGTNLLELRLVEEEALARVLGKQHGCEVAFGELQVSAELLGLVPHHVANRQEIVPWKVERRRLKILCAVPDVATFDELAVKLNRTCVPVIVPEYRIVQLLRREFGAKRQMRALDFGVVPEEQLAERRRKRKQAESHTATEALPELIDEAAFNDIYNQVIAGRDAKSSDGRAKPASQAPPAPPPAAAPLLGVAPLLVVAPSPAAAPARPPSHSSLRPAAPPYAPRPLVASDPDWPVLPSWPSPSSDPGARQTPAAAPAPVKGPPSMPVGRITASSLAGHGRAPSGPPLAAQSSSPPPAVPELPATLPNPEGPRRPNSSSSLPAVGKPWVYVSTPGDGERTPSISSLPLPPAGPGSETPPSDPSLRAVGGRGIPIGAMPLRPVSLPRTPGASPGALVSPAEPQRLPTPVGPASAPGELPLLRPIPSEPPPPSWTKGLIDKSPIVATPIVAAPTIAAPIIAIPKIAAPAAEEIAEELVELDDLEDLEELGDEEALRALEPLEPAASPSPAPEAAKPFSLAHPQRDHVDQASSPGAGIAASAKPASVAAEADDEADGLDLPIAPPVWDMPSPQSAPADTSPLAFADALRLLNGVTDRDAIAHIVLRCARGSAARALLLTVQGEVALGWDGLGEGLENGAAQAIAVPLAQESVFKLVVSTRSHYLGGLRKTQANIRFLGQSGKKVPLSAVLLPILFRGRVSHLLYLDNGHKEQAPTDIGEMLILAQKVTQTVDALVAKKQQEKP